jgi:hypothetical protein
LSPKLSKLFAQWFHSGLCSFFVWVVLVVRGLRPQQVSRAVVEALEGELRREASASEQAKLEVVRLYHRYQEAEGVAVEPAELYEMLACVVKETPLRQACFAARRKLEAVEAERAARVSCVSWTAVCVLRLAVLITVCVRRAGGGGAAGGGRR